MWATSAILRMYASKPRSRRQRYRLRSHWLRQNKPPASTSKDAKFLLHEVHYVANDQRRVASDPVIDRAIVPSGSSGGEPLRSDHIER